MKKQFLALLTAVLLSVYPAIFLYQVNSDLLEIGDLLPLVLAFTVFAAVLYGVVFKWKGGDPNSASNAVLILLIVFFLYGAIFSFLRSLDLFTIEHRTLLPVMIVLGSYAALFIHRLGETPNRLLQQGARAILVGLVLLNILMVVPVEIEKLRAARAWSTAIEENLSQSHLRTSSRKPDIYYLVIDEAAGFDVIREYWEDDRVNQYEEYFRDRGFFIASRSRSSSLNTLYEMASRLNFRYSEKDKDDRLGLMEEISQNKVMRNLRERGYTTIVFDQTRSPLAYPSKTPIVADYSFSDEAASDQYEGQRLNEFSKMVLELTMLRPLLEAEDTYDPMILAHRDNVLFAFDRIANLDDIPSPKFVYAHLLVTHVPFLFKEDGSLNEIEAFHDWNYYLDNYLFTQHKLQELAERLLSDADPDNLPVIIIESDHGARNIPTYVSGTLENYPEEYKSRILNVFFLPGFDYSSLKDDMDPVETFPLVFERYFGESFP
jgi:hypothetical protein